jgi:hypothetical protein
MILASLIGGLVLTAAAWSWFTLRRYTRRLWLWPGLLFLVAGGVAGTPASYHTDGTRLAVAFTIAGSMAIIITVSMIAAATGREFTDVADDVAEGRRRR